MKISFLSILVLLLLDVAAQPGVQPFIRLADPQRENNTVKSPRQFISGATCKTCELSIDGNEVKVYATGGFAYELRLNPGSNVVNIQAKNGSKTINKQLTYRYSPVVMDTVKKLEIGSIQIFPEGNLVVRPGDRIRFRVKALTGCKVTVEQNIPLFEMPVSASNPVPGIYQGEYDIQATDSFAGTRMLFTITDSSGQTATRRAESRITIMNEQSPDQVVTRGRLAHLLFGLGEDRLGGAKMGYIDSLIPLKIIGKVGSLYKIALTKYRTAYIPDDVVDFLPKGSFTPESLTGSWRVYGDSVFDYVTIGLFNRLAYQSTQLVDPSRIVVDIFGATNNTNWISQLENAKEVKNVYYEQLEESVLRVHIELKHRQHWGHDLFYRGNQLVIRIRRQPVNLALRNLRIAVDAGHGGSNTGAYGPTGSSEKELALAVAIKLKRALEYQGAKVIMTRNMEKFVDNKDRILLYRDSLPELLISLHLNSSGDPIHAAGTSTFYRHIGFRTLSRTIYQRMLSLGLKEFGNTGSFNFMLNSPTEYPNALVEMLFLSNPEEEMMILEEKFQQDIADKIVAGIRDFLAACESDNPAP